VILPDPGYPAYASLVNFIGAVPKTVTLREENAFRMDLDELASLVTPKTRMLIVNTPQNPTGGVLTAEDVAFVCDLAHKHDLLVVSDEIYSQLVYGFHHVSPLSQPGMRDRTVLMDGLSKSYAMTGWRLGYAVAPRPLAAKLDQLMINSSSCAAGFTQMAAIEALSAPESEHAVSRMVKVFERRRNLVVDTVNRIPGMRCARPQGAFYAFPNIEGTGFGERELADRLLTEAGVALLPGTAFGHAGAGHIRIAYTQSEDELKHGLDRIALRGIAILQRPVAGDAKSTIVEYERVGGEKLFDAGEERPPGPDGSFRRIGQIAVGGVVDGVVPAHDHLDHAAARFTPVGSGDPDEIAHRHIGRLGGRGGSAGRRQGRGRRGHDDQDKGRRTSRHGGGHTSG